jgi:cytochrome c oxidase subunit II
LNQSGFQAGVVVAIVPNHLVDQQWDNAIMGNILNYRAPVHSGSGSMTTRRSFIAVTSLGAVSLYGLWAGLDAAPLRFWENGEPSGDAMDMPATGGGHEGHGEVQGPTHDEFRKMTDEFLARYRQADGSILVEPGMTSQSMPGITMTPDAHGSAHAMPGMAEQAPAHDEAVPPLDVLMVAQQWSFDPPELRLRTGIPYRFRMMAVDAAHGASLQLGRGSHIIRLPKGVLVERELTFTEPGTYLLYCTIYCGEGHQYMYGKIQVS